MEEDPEALWTTARAMEHSVVPNGEDDAEYLGLVYRAAQRGAKGSFARALLRIRCGIEHVRARLRMRELAEQGCEEARQFLES